MATSLDAYTPTMLQADAYGGCNNLYYEGRDPRLMLEAGCFAHAKRMVYDHALAHLGDVGGQLVREGLARHWGGWHGHG